MKRKIIVISTIEFLLIGFVVWILLFSRIKEPLAWGFVWWIDAVIIGLSYEIWLSVKEQFVNVLKLIRIACMFAVVGFVGWGLYDVLQIYTSQNFIILQILDKVSLILILGAILLILYVAYKLPSKN
ncbi:MAG: hypothetical protein HY929_03640 [Euryarchaeota archaeon]|nr:hypothetical protein [Euryarchaeota archaeon]